MITLHESAYAKLNLTLDVLNKRPDGYHELKSVMQTISLCDDIQIDIDTNKPWNLSCSNSKIPEDTSNLAWKAAEVFFEMLQHNPNGVAIRITKRIPSEAGLGGGSADAGAVLRALNKHYKHPFTNLHLAEIGSRVGSDVPFCTVGGTILAQGRGELLTKQPQMPGCYIVVCKPVFSISTPALYKKIDELNIVNHPDHTAFEQALSSHDLHGIAKNLFNVFDPIVTQEYQELDVIKSICASCGAIGQQMTGSGSAVFAIMRDYKSAVDAYNMLRQQYKFVFIAEPVSY